MQATDKAKEKQELIEKLKAIRDKHGDMSQIIDDKIKQASKNVVHK